MYLSKKIVIVLARFNIHALHHACRLWYHVAITSVLIMAVMTTQIWGLHTYQTWTHSNIDKLKLKRTYVILTHYRWWARFVSPQRAGDDDPSSWRYRGQIILLSVCSIDRCCFRMAMTAHNWQASKVVPLSLWSQLCGMIVNVSGRLVRAITPLGFVVKFWSTLI